MNNPLGENFQTVVSAPKHFPGSVAGTPRSILYPPKVPHGKYVVVFFHTAIRANFGHSTEWHQLPQWPFPIDCEPRPTEYPSPSVSRLIEINNTMIHTYKLRK